MVNIVFSANSKMFKGILLSVMSMLKTCKEPLHIFLLSNDATFQKPNYTIITKEQNALLDRILKSVNGESVSTLIDVGPLYNKYFRDSKNKNTEYSPYTLNRLFVDIIDEIPDKVIYIDSDTMCCNDISELYNQNIEGYEFGAALDYMGKFWISSVYTNNGVLILNVKMMRETKMLEKSRFLVQNKWMKLPDQTAMNKAVTHKKIIDSKFNEQRDIKPDTVIKHFCKGIKYWPFFHVYNIKQWDVENVHNKFHIYMFDDIYEEYDKLVEKYPFILD